LEEHLASIFKAKVYAKKETNMKQIASSAGLLLRLLFDPEDESNLFLCNVC
jgi:hypothetical protein